MYNVCHFEARKNVSHIYFEIDIPQNKAAACVSRADRTISCGFKGLHASNKLCFNIRLDFERLCEQFMFAGEIIGVKKLLGS